MSSPFHLPDAATRPGWAPALDLAAAALAAVEPATAVQRVLRAGADRLDIGPWSLGWGELDRVLLVAAGKAAVPMSQAAAVLLGDRLAGGVAITVPGATAPVPRVTVHEGGYPLANPASLLGTRHAARLLADTTARDLVLVLLSSGAGSLLEMPAARLPLADLAVTLSALAASDATPEEAGALRTHLSAMKGGGLGRLAAPARCITLLMSDLVSGPPERLADGPTVPDERTFADAAEVLSRHDLWRAVPASVGSHIRDGLAGRVTETAKPGDPITEHCVTIVVADIDTAARAAADRAADLGLATTVLTTSLQEDAREAGRRLAATGRTAAESDTALGAGLCLVTGGQLTLTRRRLGGSGGPSRELALAAALAMDGAGSLTLVSLDTGGEDGESGQAGAIVDGSTAARARALGLDPVGALDRQDSGSFFAALGDALVTGAPTGSFVGDLVLVLAERTGAA